MTDARERLLDLLTLRATEGLDAEELLELGSLLAERPDVDPDGFERAAAALDMALAPTPTQGLPTPVRERILRDAPRHLAEAGRRPLQKPPRRRSRGVVSRQARWLALTGWAAAAALAFVLLRPPASSPPAPADAATARQALLATASDAIVVRWKATGDPTGPRASGDVVWSTALQRGYLRIHGLAKNDPHRFEYQLWIFDAKRDGRYPVDGGVFDVRRTSSDVVIPIHAALPIRKPTLFAVTVEKPGGVVVSSRERLPLVAKVGS